MTPKSSVQSGDWSKTPLRPRSGLLPVGWPTVGHSITLIASALGWVSVPSTPVEVLIAVSVGVSALHAIRPLVAHGEELIACVFGLAHGLAFAGVLADLGLRGAASVTSWLACMLGVELAQVVTIALVFSSLYLAARARWYPRVRTSLAAVALAASAGWAADRLGLLENPFDVVEERAVVHLWCVCAAIGQPCSRGVDGRAASNHISSVLTPPPPHPSLEPRPVMVTPATGP
jgi:hypothetical protein